MSKTIILWLKTCFSSYFIMFYFIDIWSFTLILLKSIIPGDMFLHFLHTFITNHMYLMKMCCMKMCPLFVFYMTCVNMYEYNVVKFDICKNITLYDQFYGHFWWKQYKLINYNDAVRIHVLYTLLAIMVNRRSLFTRNMSFYGQKAPFLVIFDSTDGFLCHN